MAQITDFLVMEDVQPVTELDWGTPNSILWFETYDGVKISIAAVKDGKYNWFRIILEPTAADPRLAAFVEVGKHALKLLSHLFHAWGRHNIHATRRVFDLNLYFTIIEIALAQLFAQ